MGLTVDADADISSFLGNLAVYKVAMAKAFADMTGVTTTSCGVPKADGSDTWTWTFNELFTKRTASLDFLLVTNTTNDGTPDSIVAALQDEDAAATFHTKVLDHLSESMKGTIAADTITNVVKLATEPCAMLVPWP